ncbi:MAG: NAD(P)H-dependent oxidoreductase [candidate division WOR-3 bacterium]
MKQILVIEGSPRHGNTETVTNWVLAGLGRGMRTTRIRAADLNIGGCRECLACTKSRHKAGCGQHDDMLEIYERMVDADLAIFTSPVFCWGVTSQLKAVVDRCFALLTGENLLKGSRWALVITAGGDHFDGADLVVQMFSRLARFAGVELLGHYVAANCLDGKRLRTDRRVAAEARAFGRELKEALKD